MTTWTKRGNVGLIKIRSKRSSVLLLRLLRIFMRPTLGGQKNTNFCPRPWLKIST